VDLLAVFRDNSNKLPTISSIHLGIWTLPQSAKNRTAHSLQKKKQNYITDWHIKWTIGNNEFEKVPVYFLRETLPNSE